MSPCTTTKRRRPARRNERKPPQQRRPSAAKGKSKFYNVYTTPQSTKGAIALGLLLRLQSCPTLRDPRDGGPAGSRPWDSPGKNTGVGCHCLLQCMKGKRESELAQSCPTLLDPMVCSPPGSSVHGIFQARVLQWGALRQ